MGHPTKVQLIKRKKGEQFYINFPAAMARAMEFSRGEIVEWVIEDKEHLRLVRRSSAQQVEKKGAAGSLQSSMSSLQEGAGPSAKSASLSEHTHLP